MFHSSVLSLKSATFNLFFAEEKHVPARHHLVMIQLYLVQVNSMNLSSYAEVALRVSAGALQTL